MISDVEKKSQLNFQCYAELKAMKRRDPNEEAIFVQVIRLNVCVCEKNPISRRPNKWQPMHTQWPIMITTQYLFQRMKSSDKMFSVALEKRATKQSTE